VRDSIYTAVTGATGIGASVVSNSVTGPDNYGNIIQILIGIVTLYSLIKQTFFKVKKDKPTE